MDGMEVRYFSDEELECDSLYLRFANPTIEIQRPQFADSQDVALKQDRHCLVIDGVAVYGGVESYELEGPPTKIILHLSDRACQVFGCESQQTIELDAISLNVIGRYMRDIMEPPQLY